MEGIGVGIDGGKRVRDGWGKRGGDRLREVG